MTDYDKSRLEAEIQRVDDRNERRCEAIRSQVERLDDKIFQKDLDLSWKDFDISAILFELQSRVRYLEAALGVKNDSESRLWRPSARRNHNLPSANALEPDPAQAAEHPDQSAVPLADVRSEPQRSPGPARQAAPDQPQAGQQADATDSEPQGEESPDSAR